MRTSLVVLLAVLPTTAIAGGRVGTGGGGGSSGGGGRLGSVSGGISGASHPGGSSGGSSSSGTSGSSTTEEGTVDAPVGETDNTYYDAQGRLRVRYINTNDGESVVVRRVLRAPRTASDPARVDAFIGVSDTYESNTSASASVAVSDSKLRIVGDGTRYWEDQAEGGRLTLTTASLQLGARLPTTGGVSSFFQVGVMYATTKNDPMMDSSITGGSVGLHVEAPLVWNSALVGDVRAVLFNHDIHAWEGRLAVRSHHLEAGVRILDFDVGPALFGPEVGLAF